MSKSASLTTLSYVRLNLITSQFWLSQIISDTFLHMEEIDIGGISAEFTETYTPGIFSQISERCGVTDIKNINKVQQKLQKFVIISPSDSICSNYPLITQHKFKSHWFTFVPNPWISFDFQHNKITLNGYYMRTYAGDSNCGHLKSWDIEGSIDNVNWEIIQSIRDSALLNSAKAEAMFKIETAKQYRSIRIKMIGKNWAGVDIMAINNIEFFGSISK